MQYLLHLPAVHMQLALISTSAYMPRQVLGGGSKPCTIVSADKQRL